MHVYTHMFTDNMGTNIKRARHVNEDMEQIKSSSLSASGALRDTIKQIYKYIHKNTIYTHT